MAHFSLAKIPAKPGKGSEIRDYIGRITAATLKNEPETYSYCCLQEADDPDNIFIFERYAKKESLEDVHMNSPEFQDLIIALKDKDLLRDELVLHACNMNCGFLSKPGCETVGVNDYFWVAEYQFKPGCRDRGLELFKEVASESLSKESGTLTYAVMKHTSQPNVVTLFERYTGKSSLEDVHFKGKQFTAMRKAIEDEKLVDGRFAKPYKFSGVGYLHRPR